MKIAARQLPDGFTASFVDLIDLPTYNGDLDTRETVLPSVLKLREAANHSSGVFWCSPEYNYAMPGVVKNVIDWLSRPLLPQNSIVGRPMNAVVVTGSTTNGSRCLTDLKRAWNACGGLSVPLPDCVINEAPSKFVVDDGIETLEPATLTMVRLAVACLVRIIESGASLALQENWQAYTTALAK